MVTKLFHESELFGGAKEHALSGVLEMKKMARNMDTEGFSKIPSSQAETNGG